MNPGEILEVLERRSAIQRGHFRLTSDRHSALFVQKFRVLEQPRLAQRFGEAIAELFGGGFEVVASPAVGAIVLGFTTALASGARLVIAEREGGVMTFRRGFALEPHERVLAVEDVITTGGSARAVVDLVRRLGANPVGVGALLDRADPARVELGAPLRALVRLQAQSWDPDACPACARGEPLQDLGSRRLAGAGRGPRRGRENPS